LASTESAAAVGPSDLHRAIGGPSEHAPVAGAAALFGAMPKVPNLPP